MNGFKFVFYLFLSPVLCFNSNAQAPSIQWQKTYGGTLDDEAHSVCNTRDGGYAVLGLTNSTDGDMTDHHLASPSSDNFWLIKLDTFGNLEWNKCLGGGSLDEGYSILQTYDGGFILAGLTSSNDGDVSGLHGGGPFGGWDDFWVVKTDSAGSIQWQKCFGGTDTDDGFEITITADSGYLVTGLTYSDDGDVLGSFYNGDALIVKLDQYGTKQWAKTIGGNDYDKGNSCKQAMDGGYLIAGTTFSTDGDLTGIPNNGSPDVWVVKLNTLGQISWQKCYGGSGGDYGNEIIVSNNGNFFVSASTTSNDSDVSGNHGGDDYWLLKADSNGTILWQKCFGGTYSEDEVTGRGTSDAGIVMIGIVNVDDSAVLGTHGFNDYWVIKIDSLGNFQWGKCLGGSFQDIPFSVCETNDGGYVAIGYTQSTDGDITFNHGGKDFWVIKLAPLGLTVPEMQNTLMDLNISQNNDELTIRFFSKQNENAKLFLYDLTGKQIFEKNFSVTEGINYNQINCGGIAKGMYFVKIDGEKNSQRVKVFID